MTTIDEIERLFNSESAPYTALEIAQQLRSTFGHDVSRYSVYRAIGTLRARAATALLVAPLDEATPALYSHDGARRIARHVVRANRQK